MGNYMWEWNGSTSTPYTTRGWKTLLNPNPTDDFDSSGVVDTAKYTTITVITANLVNELGQKGINANVTKIDCQPTVNVVTIDHSHDRYPNIQWDHYLALDVKVYFSTDKEIMPAQLDPVVGWVIVKVIEFIIIGLVAAFAIQMLKNWLQSMTTTTTTVTKYDPNTGKPIETVTTTEPSYTGIVSLAVGLGIIVVAGVAAYYLLKPKERTRRR